MRPERHARIGENRRNASTQDWERWQIAIAFRLLIQEVSPAIFFAFVLNLTTATTT